MSTDTIPDDHEGRPLLGLGLGEGLGVWNEAKGKKHEDTDTIL